MQWLNKQLDSFRLAIQRERLAHAYLLTGVPGAGKRWLARWLSAAVLGTEANSDSPVWPQHPDFHHLTTLPDKSSLSVDQIRALCSELSMTSHSMGTKVAVIEPANLMTPSAANALLKTLEEPPGDTCLILIADQVQTLPATILSRCVQVVVSPPDSDIGVQWLRSLGATGNLERALALSNGAPLRALDLLENGGVDLAEQCELGVRALIAGQADAVGLGQQLKTSDFGLLLTLIGSLVERIIRKHQLGQAKEVATLIPPGTDIRNLFYFQDRLKWLKNQPKGSYNEQLALESLFLDWQNKFLSPRLETPIMPMASTP